jgi:hypothetical protein
MVRHAPQQGWQNLLFSLFFNFAVQILSALKNHPLKSSALGLIARTLLRSLLSLVAGKSKIITKNPP